MNRDEKKAAIEWLESTADSILKDMGNSYKYHTRNLADTDGNLSYHGKLVEMIFYRMFMGILEAVDDEEKDDQMNDLIAKMRHYRPYARSNQEMLELFQEKKAQ